MSAADFGFDDVVVVRDSVRALDGFSAVVPGHGVTAIYGPSGSGKSTLLRLCNRLEIPTTGRVLYGGRDIAELDPLRLRRQVGIVFQRPTPFPGTIAENLHTADPDADPPRMREVLARVGLSGSWLDRDATALSGGEAQRMCLARTLITGPEVLLLDEPTSALDESAVDIVERAVLGLAGDGVTVLWVTHDPQQVRRVADRVLRIDAGRCVGLDPVNPPPDTLEEIPS
ncbi:ABC transporter ATP-binding protein [Gordonia amicalis]|uniref:ABC transporter ATP-binding protein n=1 Tax=Gordonia amicalis TaxID=89053 RepID=UPI0002A62896|nr:phosphate ABC transporter ATP-binding protein [Gordonia amicalis]MBA5845623.1 phosphate ABC transporter ATP-binding protein [Gordonia amicalis]MDV7102463.1 phosphate ABC transporter ATP-binding protein [Gordonia amicalis]MDV7173927.1 phosphate ABC transporter ATP-binding protein [Gordonia amicalis]NKX79690.1 phosphate ABC transporter ATP-binding protein [Gordonia amicalis]UKO90781.1 phosphate ABC transporter ATP-binding protein [Gordonia amicalis]